MAYADESKRSDFIKGLGENAFFVCDLDGNVLNGFSLQPGHTLDLSPGDNPENRAIPSGTTLEQLNALVEHGVLKKAIFATKAMDARLPAEIVSMLNYLVSTEQPFRLAGLTSRSSEDALNIMAESGVEHPDLVTLVADSGATMRILGVRHDVYVMTHEDKAFIQSIENDRDGLQAVIRDTVSRLGYDPQRCPDLYFEKKNIAANVHYRTVLNEYGQGEGSELDKALGKALKQHLDASVAIGPKGTDDAAIFKTLDGPATVEVKIASVNKGYGLEALTRAAMKSPSPPTAIVFSGDDVCKGNGNPGTDYFAMARAEEIGETYGVSIYNVHTHHPEGAQLDGSTPDPQKSPERLLETYQVPTIHLALPTPQENVGLMAEIVTVQLFKAVRSG